MCPIDGREGANLRQLRIRNDSKCSRGPSPVRSAATLPSCVCGLHGTVTMRSERSPRRHFAPLPDGGEVFAIGNPSRMPLAQLSYELLPANDGTAWLQLRHAASGLLLGMQSPGSEGAWMLQVGRVSSAQAAARDIRSLFCVSREASGLHLYSAAVGGYVTRHGPALLRGHAPATKRMPMVAKPKPPTYMAAHASNASLVSLWRVSARARASSELRWRCRAEHPANRAANANTAASAAASATASATTDTAGASATASANTAAKASANGSKLAVLLFATKGGGFFCDTLLSALSHGLSPTVLGYNTSWRGNFQKLLAAREAVAAFPASTVVLFADAYDVLFAA